MSNAIELMKAIGGLFTTGEVQSYGDDGLNLTIKSAGVEIVGQGKDAEEKPVLRFDDCKKGLVLSKGRCQALADLYGKEDLVGKTINLFTVIERGKVVSMIRAAR
jgi:hypothetical protein